MMVLRMVRNCCVLAWAATTGAACSAPVGRPLVAAPAATVPADSFDAIIDCAGLAGLMASELPGAVHITLDEATTLRFHGSDKTLYLDVVVDPEQIPAVDLPERKSVGEGRGDEIYACALERTKVAPQL